MEVALYHKLEAVPCVLSRRLPVEIVVSNHWDKAERKPTQVKGNKHAAQSLSAEVRSAGFSDLDSHNRVPQ